MDISRFAFPTQILWPLMLCAAISISQCKVAHKIEPGMSKSRTSKPAKPSKPATGAEMSARKDIVAYAAKYKGSKYTPTGKRPDTGFDCSGFTSYVMDHFDIDLSPAAREQVKQGHGKDILDAQPGDLIFFRRSASEPIFHVSLVKSNDGKSLYVIHSTTSRGVIEEDVLNSKYWKPYIDSVRDVVSEKF